MKDRDREEERGTERERDYERENGANGDDRKGALGLLPQSGHSANDIIEREEAVPAHDDLDTAE